MLPENFSKALLDSATDDAAPSPEATARAAASLERVLGEIARAAPAGGAAVATGKAASMLKVALSAAAIAGAAGVSGGYAIGRATTPAPAALPSTPARSSEAQANVAAAPSVAANAAPSASTAPAPAPADACTALEAAPSKCSSDADAKTVTFAITNRCSEATLDLFWVDPSCHEVFRGIVPSGGAVWQDSWDTHVFRLRDHATHRLVRELAPPRVDGARDRAAYWKGPATELPVVVVREGDPALPEAAPLECTRGGGRAAILRVKNERKSGPIALMQVDTDCQETGWGRSPRIIAPGATYEARTSEGHAFRVRDASGALLLDIPPTMLDTTTYLTVP